MVGIQRVLMYAIHMASDLIAHKLANNPRFQRFVHVTNHKLFGTPMPREEEYYQHYLKSQQEMHKEHQIEQPKDQNDVVDVLKQETREAFKDLLPGGRFIFGDKPGDAKQDEAAARSTTTTKPGKRE